MLGFGTLKNKIFGSANDRKIKAARHLVEKINALEPEFAPMVNSAPQLGATGCLAAKSGSIQILGLAPSGPPEWDAPLQPKGCLATL